MKMPPVVTCDNCGLTYYQTTAPHVCAEWTKGQQPMTTIERQRLTQEAADLIIAKVHEGRTIDEAVAELTTHLAEHESVARGGEGERWELGPLVHHGGIEQREVRRAGVDPFNGGHVCTAAAADAERIVTEHNQDHSLLAERERLREALQQIAAFDDASANLILRKEGSYRGFDEPGAVQVAREALEGKGK